MRFLFQSKLILLFSIGLFFLACQNDTGNSATVKITAAETDIAKNLIQGSFDELWAGLDSTKIENYHTDDFYILENGAYWTNQEIRDFMKAAIKAGDPPTRKNRMEYIHIEKQGTAISIAYNNYGTFFRQDSLIGQAQWLESALAIPTTEGWRLRMMHSTFIPQGTPQ